MTTFSPEVVAAVLGHMNDDHRDDSLVIVRAFGAPAATAATMTGLDTEAGEWSVETGGPDPVVLRVPWLGTVAERADLRREVVALYDAAVERLGLPPRDGH